MNLQWKRIYGRVSSWTVRGKMATISGDKHCKSNRGKRRKPAKNRAFHKIISSFQAVSPHLIWHTFLQQCISLPISSTFNANMIQGRGLIFLVKYLVCACFTPPFVPRFCSPGGATTCERDGHVWIQNRKKSFHFGHQKVSQWHSRNIVLSNKLTLLLQQSYTLLLYFWLQEGWKRWQVRNRQEIKAAFDTVQFR